MTTALDTLHPPISVAILTISDRCARGVATDASGPALAERAVLLLGAIVVAQACVPDDLDAIVGPLRHWCDESPRPDLILTTGGTGLTPRDLTPEATASILKRQHPALLELARYRSLPTTPKAFLSRGQAGTRAQTLILNLPGSPKGATEMLSHLADVLPHAIRMLRGIDTGHRS